MIVRAGRDPRRPLLLLLRGNVLASNHGLQHCLERRVVVERSDRAHLNPTSQGKRFLRKHPTREEDSAAAEGKAAGKRLRMRRVDKCLAAPAMMAGRTWLSILISWPLDERR